jgi:hypothetical protein
MGLRVRGHIVSANIAGLSLNYGSKLQYAAFSNKQNHLNTRFAPFSYEYLKWTGIILQERDDRSMPD